MTAATLDDTTLLRTVATAIVQLSRRRAPGDLVYEDGVQRAYNHLVLRCLLAGTEPPASVPGMVTWAARTPLGEWPRLASLPRGMSAPRGRRDPHPDAVLPRVGDARRGRPGGAIREPGDRRRARAPAAPRARPRPTPRSAGC